MIMPRHHSAANDTDAGIANRFLAFKGWLRSESSLDCGDCTRYSGDILNNFASSGETSNYVVDVLLLLIERIGRVSNCLDSLC